MAFYQWKALSSKLSLDAKKKAIVFGGSQNFDTCNHIPEVVLGTGVTSLPANFFLSCTGVRKLYFKGKPTYASNTFCTPLHRATHGVLSPDARRCIGRCKLSRRPIRGDVSPDTKRIIGREQRGGCFCKL